VIPECKQISLNIDQGIIKTDWPSGDLYLAKSADGWVVTEPAEPRLKGPHRYGCFKNAFNHDFVYVYGTGGGQEDTRANIAKARYDLEHWGYRGNGTFELVADTEFDPTRYEGRNIILIGNADTNSTWDLVLKDCPVRVGRGVVKIGERELKGNNLAMLFTYPRSGSSNNTVGVIAGTGTQGTKLTTRIGYFVSGAGFPDLVVYGADMLETGTAGVLAAGFFGEDWSIGKGEIVWRDSPKEE
jgi:hypothetical protein